ncbi:MAG: formyltransferase family protein, partial [Rhodospirillaceae bacterium]
MARHPESVMVSEILLLTDPALAEALMARLQAAAPSAPVRTIHSKQAFAARCQTSLEDTRVITVGTDILVPPEVLQRLPGPGYNFHPGPPEVRGRYPSCFALYAGAAMFGSTVHELAPQVDSGAIVAVDRF